MTIDPLDGANRQDIDNLKSNWKALSKPERRAIIHKLLNMGLSRRGLAKELGRSEGAVRNQLKYGDPRDDDDAPVASDDHATILDRIIHGKELKIYPVARPTPLDTPAEWVAALVKATKQFIDEELQLPPVWAMQALWFAMLRQQRWHLHSPLPQPILFTDPLQVLKATRPARRSDDAFQAGVHRLAIGLLQVAPFPNMRNSVIRQVISAYRPAVLNDPTLA